jgi:uncharacterized membrane protein (DUF2068 family)
MATKTGSIRAVAAFEATKGVVVLVAGLGVLSYADDRVRETFDHLVEHMHLDPSKHVPESIAAAIANPSDSTLVKLAIAAALYALVRFAEAFGLWHSKRWAEWFGLASGAIYVPFELYQYIAKPSNLSASLLAINLAVVGVLYHAVKPAAPTMPPGAQAG